MAFACALFCCFIASQRHLAPSWTPRVASWTRKSDPKPVPKNLKKGTKKKDAGTQPNPREPRITWLHYPGVCPPFGNSYAILLVLSFLAFTQRLRIFTSRPLSLSLSSFREVQCCPPHTLSLSLHSNTAYTTFFGVWAPSGSPMPFSSCISPSLHSNTEYLPFSASLGSTALLISKLGTQKMNLKHIKIRIAFPPSWFMQITSNYHSLLATPTSFYQSY